MDNESWIFVPWVGCGPFQFEMSEASLHEIAGLPTAQNGKLNGDVANQSILSAEFDKNALVCIELDPLKLPSLKFEMVDLLSMPTLEVIALLEKANAGVNQTQGGSLYFDTIGLAILQFETCSTRSVMMWSPSYDHGEALAEVTLETVANYYCKQRSEAWPRSDLFGKDQEPRADG